MKYAVYAQYSVSRFCKNEILSTHSGRELAERALKSSCFSSFLSITEVVETAKKGKSITGYFE